MQHLFNYRWYLKDGYPAPNIEYHGKKVFGTFVCGGGSTMGYKLAGYNHLGGVEIDKKVADVYNINHNPKYLFVEDIREFNIRTDLPQELYELDLLDGSPPCSTFSMAGSREKAWNKEKVFREGQKKQTLDDLVFVYCETILKLKPKVFILENVKGIIQGNAKLYSKQIVNKLTAGGYTVQVFCLNAATMGVPQKRERVFFIGFKNELKFPKLKLEFNEKPILFEDVFDKNDVAKNLPPSILKMWNLKAQTDRSCSQTDARVNGTNNYFNWTYQKNNEVLNTIASKCCNILFDIPRLINNNEAILCGSYPLDYNFNGIEPKYLIGMSVPPVMTAQIANQIRKQWLTT